MVPQAPSQYTSTRPSLLLDPFAKRTLDNSMTFKFRHRCAKNEINQNVHPTKKFKQIDGETMTKDNRQIEGRQTGGRQKDGQTQKNKNTANIR